MKQTEARLDHSNRRRIVPILVLLLSIMLMFGAARPVQAASKIKLTKTTAVMAKGEKLTLKVKGSKKKVSWSSTKSGIVSVSKGTLTAKKQGKATIKAKVAGKTLKCKVTVVAVSASGKTLYKDEKFQLSVYNGKNTVWYSEDSSIATVDNKGLVVAKAPGKTNIICKSNGKTFQTVICVPCLNESYISLKGKDQAFALNLLYADGDITWSSTDSSIATVDKDGLVKAKNAGSALIVASYEGRNYSALVSVIEEEVVIEENTDYNNGLFTTPPSAEAPSESEVIPPVEEVVPPVEEVVPPAEEVIPPVEEVVVPAEKVVLNLYLDRDALPYSSVSDRLTVSLSYQNDYGLASQSSYKNMTYTIYKQNASVNKCSSDSLSSYMSDHGCAACSLTTVLSAYGKMDPQEGPAATIKKNGMEYKALGESQWTANYKKSSSNRMPISMLGFQKVLDYYGIPAEYIQTFDDYEAIDQIREHLLEGKPVVIEVCTKKRDLGYTSGSTSKKWSNSSHTMVLIGLTLMDGKEYAVVADSADRSESSHGTGNKRIKYATLSELVSFMFSNTEMADGYYYQSKAKSGGYVLVD